MNQPPSFNAWHEPWIHALDLQGMSCLLSIDDVLRNAHQLRSLSDGSPIIVGGTQRLLTAIMQFIEQPQILKHVGRIYEQGRFDQAKLDQFAQNYAQRFDIFDPALPFLQTNDVAIDALANMGKTKGAKNSIVSTSIAAMFADIPSASNRTHYYHTIDDQHGLCPACCTAGLVIASAFAQNAGRGWRASITGDPPLYIFPVGNDLFQGLALSLISSTYQPKIATEQRQTLAPWNYDGMILKEGKQIQTGYVESLTFLARRVRLFPEAVATNCTRCGTATETVVKVMFWESGFYRETDNEPWRDPFVAFYTGSDKKLKSLKINKGKALWREYATFFLSGAEKVPSVVQQMSQLNGNSVLSDQSLMSFRCIGMKTDGKAKVMEWVDESLEVPPPLLSNPSFANVVNQALDKAEICEWRISSIFKQHVKQSGAKQGKNKNELLATLNERMQDRFWNRLAPKFRDFVTQTVSKDEIEVLRTEWEQTIVRIARECLNEALKQRGDSSELLQSHAEALNHFGQAIANYRKEGWTWNRPNE